MDSEGLLYFSFYFYVCLKFYIAKKSKDIRIGKRQPQAYSVGVRVTLVMCILLVKAGNVIDMLRI